MGLIHGKNTQELDVTFAKTSFFNKQVRQVVLSRWHDAGRGSKRQAAFFLVSCTRM